MTVYCVAAFLNLIVAAEPKTSTFAKVLGEKRVADVVQSQTEGFARQFQNMTAREIVIKADFYGAVVKQVAETGARTEESEPEVVLRRGIGKFLADLTWFLLATRAELIFESKAVGRYLEAAKKAGVCGEIPCSRGCGDNPCDWYCGRCRP